jgi:toxin ParE1/3/4
MSSFSLTRCARVDLMSIARFTEKSWGREQRLAYIKQFDETLHLLSNTPVIGNNCNYIKRATKNFLKAATLFSILRMKKKCSDRTYST